MTSTSMLVSRNLLRAGLGFGGDEMSVGQITMMPRSTLK
jgi:hypothetical protein